MQDEWIHEAVLDVVIGVVLIVETNIDVQCLWSWVLWNWTSYRSRVTLLSINENLLSICIRESNLELAAVAIWALKVVSCYLKPLSLRVLRNTIGWIERSYFWSVVELYLMLSVLPLLTIG